MSSKPRNASRSRRRPWLLPAIIGLVVLLGFGWWWTQRKAGGEESAYRTTQVERGDIRVAISALTVRPGSKVPSVLSTVTTTG